MTVITRKFSINSKKLNPPLLPLQGHECTLYLLVWVCVVFVRVCLSVFSRDFFSVCRFSEIIASALNALRLLQLMTEKWKKRNKIKRRTLYVFYFYFRQYTYLVQNLYLLFVLFVYCMRKAMFIIRFGLWPISLFISNLYISGTHIFLIYIFLFSLLF